MSVAAAPARETLEQPLSATRRATDSLRELIIRRKLGPGQQLRQDHLATLLGVSRIPIREALKGLESEGLVIHEPNRGYFVASLEAAALEQIYVMRRLLETEVLRRIEWPDKRELQDIRAINTQLFQAFKRGALSDAVVLNRQFHFAVFALAGLPYMVNEIERLWHQSEQYRALYLADAAARRRVFEEHELIVQALRGRDRPALIEVADRHRIVAEEHLLLLLRDTSGGAPGAPKGRRP
jgi:DNA-binding GntR family transcriptional regulator